MQEIRCCSPKCNKVVGELETGKARFKCKHCSTYTVAEIQPAPAAVEQNIQKATQWEGTATAYIGKFR